LIFVLKYFPSGVWHYPSPVYLTTGGRFKGSAFRSGDTHLFNFIFIFFVAFFAFQPAWSFRNTCTVLLGSSHELQLIPNKAYAYEHPEKALFKIEKVQGLQHTYIAVFNHSVYMNWALGRAATFQTQGRVISDQGLSQKDTVIQSFAGHDLPAVVLNRFEAALRVQSFKKHNTAPVRYESKFWESVIWPILRMDPDAILIAASLNEKPEKIISHELLHAQFYENPDLQSKIQKFWNENVTPEDRKLYLEILKHEGYDTDNSEMVINEFFAYTLEKGNPVIFPPELIQRYRIHLHRALLGFYNQSRVTRSHDIPF
jgi:hypothetical protein